MAIELTGLSVSLTLNSASYTKSMQKAIDKANSLSTILSKVAISSATIASLDKMSAKIEAINTKLKSGAGSKMRDDILGASTAAKDLKNTVSSTRYSPIAKGITKAMANLDKRAKSVKKSMISAGGGLQRSGGGSSKAVAGVGAGAIGAGIISTGISSIDSESDLSRVISLSSAADKGTESFNRLRNAISQSISGSVTDFEDAAKGMVAAGRAGFQLSTSIESLKIASDISLFSGSKSSDEMKSLLSMMNALSLDAESVAASMSDPTVAKVQAKVAENMQTIVDQVALAANKSPTTFSLLSKSMARSASVMKGLNMSTEEQLVLLSMFAKRNDRVGTSAGVAAKNIGIALTKAFSTAPKRKAMEVLGLDKKTVRKSMSAVFDRMAEVRKSLEGVDQKEMFTEALYAVFPKLNIAEVTKAVDQAMLIPFSERTKSLAPEKAAGYVDKMASIMDKSPAIELKKAITSISNAAEAFGSAMTSVLAPVASAIGDIAIGFLNLSAPIKKTIALVATIGAVASVTVAAVLAIALVAPPIVAAFLAIKTAITFVGTSAALMVGAFRFGGIIAGLKTVASFMIPILAPLAAIAATSLLVAVVFDQWGNITSNVDTNIGNIEGGLDGVSEKTLSAGKNMSLWQKTVGFIEKAMITISATVHRWITSLGSVPLIFKSILLSAETAMFSAIGEKKMVKNLKFQAKSVEKEINKIRDKIKSDNNIFSEMFNDVNKGKGAASGNVLPRIFSKGKTKITELIDFSGNGLSKKISRSISDAKKGVGKIGGDGAPISIDIKHVTFKDSALDALRQKLDSEVFNIKLDMSMNGSASGLLKGLYSGIGAVNSAHSKDVSAINGGIAKEKENLSKAASIADVIKSNKIIAEGNNRLSELNDKLVASKELVLEKFALGAERALDSAGSYAELGEISEDLRNNLKKLVDQNKISMEDEIAARKKLEEALGKSYRPDFRSSARAGRGRSISDINGEKIGNLFSSMGVQGDTANSMGELAMSGASGIEKIGGLAGGATGFGVEAGASAAGMAAEAAAIAFKKVSGAIKSFIRTLSSFIEDSRFQKAADPMIDMVANIGGAVAAIGVFSLVLGVMTGGALLVVGAIVAAAAAVALLPAIILGTGAAFIGFSLSLLTSTEKFNQMQTLISDSMDKTSEALNPFADAFLAMSTTFHQLMGAVSVIVAAFSKLFNVTDVLYNVFRFIAVGILQSVIIFNNVLLFISPVVATVVGAFMIFSKVILWFPNVLIGVFSGIFKMLSPYLKGVADLFKSLQPIIFTFMGLFELAVKVLLWFPRLLMNIGLSVYEFLTPAFEVLGSALSWIAGVFTTVGDALGVFWDWLKTIPVVGDWFDTPVTDKVAKGLETFTGTTEDANSGLEGIIATMGSTSSEDAVNIANDRLSGLGKQSESTAESMKNLPEGFKVELHRFRAIDPTAGTNNVSGRNEKVSADRTLTSTQNNVFNITIDAAAASAFREDDAERIVKELEEATRLGNFLRFGSLNASG